MTTPIFTIPARLVVEGMILASDGRAISRVQCDPPGPLRRLHMAIPEAFDPDAKMPEIAAYDYPHDAPVDVTLPGPSPRELLCSCLESDEWRERVRAKYTAPEGDWLAIVPPHEHLESCSVHRLRLRLLAVGATWSPESTLTAEGVVVERGCWIVDGTPVWRRDLASNFAEYARDGAAEMRAAFCEPEVQP